MKVCNPTQAHCCRHSSWLPRAGKQLASPCSLSWQKMPKRGKTQRPHTICANQAALVVFWTGSKVSQSDKPYFFKIKLFLETTALPSPHSPYSCTLPHTSQETFSLLQDTLWGPVETASCHINFSV